MTRCTLPLALVVLFSATILVSQLTSTAPAPLSPFAPIQLPITVHRSLPVISSSSRERAPGSRITLGDCGQIGFSVPLTIGTGATAQTFQVVLDTGSGLAAVVSSLCPAATCLNASPVYTLTSTAIDPDLPLHQSYGQGSWSGPGYLDTLSLGGIAPVPRVLFGAMITQRDFLPTDNCQMTQVTPTPLQGIVGMGFTTVSDYPSYATLLGEAFALQLCESGGQLWIGADSINQTLLTSPLLYAPLASNESERFYYSIAVSGLYLNGTLLATQETAPSFSSAIVDSGTTLNLLPPDVYSAFVDLLESNTAFSSAFPQLLQDPSGCFPTSSSTATLNDELPRMAWEINGQTFTLTPVDSYLRQIFVDSEVYYCLGIGSASSDLEPDMDTILGWATLNQFITVYDQPNERVGFASTTSCQNTWSAAAWSLCLPSCGNGTQTTQLTCVNQLGVEVPANACQTQPPPTTQACSNGPCFNPGGPIRNASNTDQSL